jgi:hypothetical protein
MMVRYPPAPPLTGASDALLDQPATEIGVDQSGASALDSQPQGLVIDQLLAMKPPEGLGDVNLHVNSSHLLI